MKNKQRTVPLLTVKNYIKVFTSVLLDLWSKGAAGVTFVSRASVCPISDQIQLQMLQRGLAAARDETRMMLVVPL